MSKILKDIIKINKKNKIIRAVKESIDKDNKNKGWNIPKKIRLQKKSWVKK